MIGKEKVELVELRYSNVGSVDNEGDSKIGGYAMTFNQPSVNLGGFVEKILPTALDGVDLTDIPLLSQHNTADLLARTSSDTMAVTRTEVGLYFSAILPNTNLGRDTYELIKRGDLKYMSFGFTVIKDKWDITTTPHTRIIEQIGSLKELSVVTSPAYKTSSVAKRMATQCDNLQECLGMEVKPNPLLEEAKAILASI